MLDSINEIQSNYSFNYQVQAARENCVRSWEIAFKNQEFEFSNFVVLKLRKFLIKLFFNLSPLRNIKGTIKY